MQTGCCFVGFIFKNENEEKKIFHKNGLSNRLAMKRWVTVTRNIVKFNFERSILMTDWWELPGQFYHFLYKKMVDFPKVWDAIGIRLPIVSIVVHAYVSSV